MQKKRIHFKWHTVMYEGAVNKGDNSDGVGRRSSP